VLSLTVQRQWLADVRGIFQFREALVELVKRDLKLRYRRSALGIVWTMLNPLLMMLVTTIVFSSVFHFAIHNFPTYVLTGYVVWGFFSQATVIGSSSLLTSGSLVRRVYVPPALFPLASVNAAGVNLLLSLVPLFLIVVLTGGTFTWALLSLPVSLFLLLLFTSGLTLLLAAASVFYLDAMHTYQVLLVVWMYVTPIFYPIEIVPEQYQFIFRLNPLFHLIQIFRDPIYAGTWPDMTNLAMAMAYSVAMLFIGWWYFERSRRAFASYL
jgi:ABC-type polysaccharide/polyol phosphate export permease